MFAERIVGLRLGEVVYDGTPDKLSPEVLTEIYGEEDWAETIRPVEEDEGGGPEDEASAADDQEDRGPKLDRDRLAGMT